MFKDNDFLVGKSISKIYSDESIILPWWTKAEAKEKIVFLNFTKVLTIYSANRIGEKFKKTYHMLIEDGIDPKIANDKLMYLWKNNLIDKNIRKDRKLIIPEILLQQYDLKDKVIIAGFFDNIKIFKDLDSLKQFEKEYENYILSKKP